MRRKTETIRAYTLDKLGRVALRTTARAPWSSANTYLPHGAYKTPSAMAAPFAENKQLKRNGEQGRGGVNIFNIIQHIFEHCGMIEVKA